MLNRWVEHGLLDVLSEIGAGAIAVTALHRECLTSKYLAGVPADSRANRDWVTAAGSVDAR